MQRKTILDTRDKSIKDFSIEMNFIIEAIFNKNKKDGDIIEIRDKFNVARKEQPILIIESSGPYLWKYREEILAEKVSFFLGGNFEEDIIEAKKATDAVPEISQLDDIPVILNKIKRTWHCLSGTEKIVIIKKVKGLLKNYATYLSSCKELNNLE